MGNKSAGHERSAERTAARSVQLPRAFLPGSLLVLEAIQARRSVRDYSGEALSLAEVATLLFATQGITSEESWKKRAAPSAGALYPMETHLIVNRVTDLWPGHYRYLPEKHELLLERPGEMGRELRRRTLHQPCLEEAAVVFVWTAVPARMAVKYGGRGIRYIYLEAGHIAQNLYLQGTALGLGVVAIGAFDDDGLNELLEVDGQNECAVYLAAVGRAR
jgi:SagB-type dehydrogenase family enzyme